MKGFLWCPHCKSPHAMSTLTCPTTGNALAMGLTRPEQSLGPGTVIAKRYRVQRWGVEESIGLVYDATQVGTHRRVSVKVVREDERASAKLEAEILEMEREARAACMVEHPNVSTVLDFGKLGEREAFLVRERPSGETLASTLRTDGALKIADAADILSQILSGLDALHRVGIVHRDLGTHNIFMVRRAGCPPLAKIARLGRCSAPKLGTPRDPPSAHYSSPELLRGGEVDHRSDLFACGVILFEMLFGRRPFDGSSPDEVREAILNDARPSASQLRPLVGAHWLDVVDKSLHIDPARRHQSALEFQAALPASAGHGARLHVLLTDTDDEGTEAENALPTAHVRDRAGVNGPSKRDPYIGRRLANKYELESLLGSGSAGAVYKAMHLGLRRPVAVKVLHERNRRSRLTVERFKAEALLASRLDHPNVMRVLDSGQEPDGTLYLVMEYVEGKTLGALLEEQLRLPADRAVNIAIHIASALVVAHAAGIVHRDVKPENIIVLEDRDEAGRSSDLAKVGDFGIAKIYHREGGNADLTGVGVVLGSPVYIAPELIRGQPCDARTDIYAVAVTLFEMLTGRLPHEADRVTELFQAKLTAPPIRLSTFLPDVDALLEDIVMRALESNPELRHASALELRTELLEALKELQSAPRSTKTVSIWPDPNE